MSLVLKSLISRNALWNMGKTLCEAQNIASFTERSIGQAIDQAMVDFKTSR